MKIDNLPLITEQKQSLPLASNIKDLKKTESYQ